MLTELGFGKLWVMLWEQSVIPHIPPLQGKWLLIIANLSLSGFPLILVETPYWTNHCL